MIFTILFHHQSIKKITKGFKVIAKAKDGVIEAFENINGGMLCIGVQWHPEELWQKDILQFKLFKYFIDVASKF